jgi:phage terminase small subunit
MTRIPVKTENTPQWAAELTLRERRFVEEYIIDLNGRRAGVRAGLGNPKSAGEIASRMRKKATVAAAISALMAERNGVTATAVVNELGAIAFSKITDYLRIENGRLVLAVADLNDLSDEAKSAIAKLRERINEDGSISIEVELHDKIPALNLLGKSVGVFVDRQEISGPNGGPIEVAEADPMDRINERLSSLRGAQEAEALAEFDSPVARIAPPQPERRGLVIDAQAE